MRSKRYSESAITTYSEALKLFLMFYREKAVADLNNEDVIIYNNQVKPPKPRYEVHEYL